LAYKKGDSLATRKAYGNALKRLSPQFPGLVSLDCEVMLTSQGGGLY
jgi:transketolase